jgi:hypothetical protein
MATVGTDKELSDLLDFSAVRDLCCQQPYNIFEYLGP